MRAVEAHSGRLIDDPARLAGVTHYHRDGGPGVVQRATLALERGIHPRVVQERLGHSTIAITLSIHSHVAPTLHDEAAEIVSDLIL